MRSKFSGEFRGQYTYFGGNSGDRGIPGTVYLFDLSYGDSAID